MPLLRPKAKAQGQRVRIENPGALKRVGALLLDFAIFSPVFCETFRLLYKTQNLSLGLLVASSSIYLLRWITLLVLKDSIGTRLFFYRDTMRGWVRRLGVFVLIGATLPTSAWILKSIPAFSSLHTPNSRLDLNRLKAYFPKAHEMDQFQILPFYFTLGIWPKTFEGKRYFFSIPYEKGPPKHYLGRIVLALSLPDIKLEIEGPKTPEKRTVNEWKECFENPFSGLNCRAFFLRRHWNELEAKYGRIWNWNLSWFSVLGAQEELKPQGLWITAKVKNVEVHRVVLVSRSGVQQSLTLQTDESELGQKAITWFTGIIQGLRMYDQIQSVRIASENHLKQINLHPLKNLASNEIPIDQVLDAQAALLAQISVRPSDFDAYFHLGGTSILMIRYFSDPKNTLQNQSFRGTPPLILLREVIENAYRYAKDIAPTDARVHELSTLLAEARRF